MSPTSRLRALAVACASVALAAPVALPISSAHGSPRRPAAAHTGIPHGAPKAAQQAEPTLPEPSRHSWPFPNRFPRTSGSGRLSGGASLWSDFLYDDHGAAAPSGFPLTPASMISDLAPTQGIAGYRSPTAEQNGADIFRAAVGVTPTASYWRVDWNTLADPQLPIAEWTFDTDDNAATGGSAWPAAAGVHSAGIDKALVVSAKHASVVDVRNGKTVDVATHGGGLTVDRQSRSFIVRVPRALLPVSGRWRVRLAAGVATAPGTTFAEPDYGAGTGLPVGTLRGLPRVYNVTFRSVRQEPPVYSDGAQTDAQVAALGAALRTGPLATLGLDGTTRFVTGNFWMEDHQADVLGSGGDVSPFALTVDWARLQHHAATPEPRPTGYSNRWYVSRLHLGQGVVSNAGNQPSGDLRPNYLGRVQPYAVYVPRGTDFSRSQPLTWVLHSLGVNLNQYGALDPQLLQELCQDRHSICASTEGFGPDGWYFDEAEQDFWSVWHALATSYDIDTDHTVISGYSMGGWASFKLALAHPDLFSESMPLEGPPVCGIRIIRLLNGQTVKLPADGVQPGRCGADGDTVPVLGNARWLPYVMTQGGTDELVPAPSNLQTGTLFAGLGERYTLFFLPEEDHLVYATQDRFGGVVDALGRTPARVRNPARISYSWFPNLDRKDLGIGTTTAYWLSGLRSTTSKPGAVASVEALSKGRADPKVTVVKRGPTLVTTPLPATRTQLAWRLGAALARRDRLTLRLTKVAALTVNAARAGLSCPVITTHADGATRLTVTHLDQGTSLRAGGRHATAGRSGVVSLRLPSGSSTLTCGHVIDNGAVGNAGRTNSASRANQLASTGGLPPVGWALALIGLAVAARSAARRRPGRVR